MGGSIDVASEPGQGSRFFFEVPLKVQTFEASKRKHATNLHGMRCLVVDDNHEALHILQKQLAYFSLESDGVSSAKMAFDAVKNAEAKGQSFDLVFMDYRMPEIDGLDATRIIKHELGLQYPPKVVFVTASHTLDGHLRSEIRKLCDAILLKPINSSLLYDTLAGVKRGEEVQFTSTKQHTHYDYAQLEPIKGARILVVDDNSINQQIMMELLGQAGFWVEIAENGLVALESLRDNFYDAVLMDIQMPVMDGYDATLKIRQNPLWDDLPVIAMTANVLEEDVKRSFEVGMNAHVGKPINETELFTALLTHIPAGERIAPHQELHTDTEQLTLPVNLREIDVPNALLNLNGNKELLSKLLREFSQDYGQIVPIVLTAMDTGDYIRVQRIAHTLKGVSGSLGAVKLNGLFSQLEQSIKDERYSDSYVLIDRIRPILDAVNSDLVTWIAETDKLDNRELKSVTVEELPALLSRLEVLLQEMDPSSAELANILSMTLPDSLKAKELAEAADGFDFDKALALLNEFRGEMGL
jgi:two-component system sensor histidine kinase/response regulator